MSQLINELKGSAALNCVTSEGRAETEGSGLQVDLSVRIDCRRRRKQQVCPKRCCLSTGQQSGGEKNIKLPFLVIKLLNTGDPL
jgi:hypothetical protein